MRAVTTLASSSPNAGVLVSLPVVASRARAGAAGAAGADATTGADLVEAELIAGADAAEAEADGAAATGGAAAVAIDGGAFSGWASAGWSFVSAGPAPCSRRGEISRSPLPVRSTLGKIRFGSTSTTPVNARMSDGAAISSPCMRLTRVSPATGGIMLPTGLGKRNRATLMAPNGDSISSCWLRAATSAFWANSEARSWEPIADGISKNGTAKLRYA